MWNSFLAEWPRIRRRSVLSALAAMIALGVLGTYFTLTRAHQIQHGLIILRLVAPDGFEALMAHAAGFFALTSLITVAAVVGAEWSQGTLRNLLVQEPGRLRVLGGTFCALLVYVLVSGVIATAASLAAAAIVAPGAGVDTTAWWSADGIESLRDFVVNMLLTMTGWSVIGLFVAVLVRNAAGAVGASIAWLLVVEGLAGEIWPDQAPWLPAHIFDAVLAGGTKTVAYGTALWVAALYAAVMLTITAVSFRSRDVLA